MLTVQLCWFPMHTSPPTKGKDGLFLLTVDKDGWKKVCFGRWDNKREEFVIDDLSGVQILAWAYWPDPAPLGH